MKVILLHDVPHVGRQYEVKEVAPGFARNFLLPRRRAVPATPARMKQYESMQAQTEKERELSQELLAKNIQALDGKKFTLYAPANEAGGLYAKITAPDIARFLSESEEARMNVPEDVFKLPEALKTVGTHRIALGGADAQAVFELEIARAERAEEEKIANASRAA